MFEKSPGSVFVPAPDGAMALNASGLPLDVFTAMLDALTNQVGCGQCNVRNAQPEDGLGPGAWYVLIPKTQEVSNEPGGAGA